MLKSWWKSKTVWWNILSTVLAIIQGIQGNAWIPAEYQVLIVTIINTVLRFLTTQPVNIPGKKVPKE